MYPGTYAKTQPDKVAALRVATDETLTYRQLDERSNQLARLLHANGLRPDAHVAVFMENHLAYFEVAWACLRAGLYIVPINRHLTAEEAAYIVENSDADALVASAALPQSADLARLCGRPKVKLAVAGAVEGMDDYEAALASQPAEPLAEEAIGGMMFYSSGTTGRPKGINRARPAGRPVDGNPNISSRSMLFGVDQDTVYLSPAPIYHGAPLGFSLGVQQEGGTVVVMDRFDALEALALIERHRITHSQWVPTMFVRMLKLDAADRARFDLSSHRCAIHAAAPCPVEVKRRMIDWWGPIIEEYYSSTENVGLTLIGSKEWLAHPGSVGKALIGTFHICDDEGRELPPMEAGVVYGDVSAGAFSYHKDPTKTAEATHPTQPTWMTCGDIGYLDAESYLYLTDRKAFMIISGGVNIYPQQIEDVLALHPKIADVAVIGVPNPDLGEEVKAVVEPAAGIEPSEALAREIMDFVEARLGRQLTPRSVDFTDALPRLPTGKLAKKPLREKYWGASSGSVPLSVRLS